MDPKNQTMEQQGFQKRVQDFTSDLIKLQEKHHIVMMAVMKIEPDGSGIHAIFRYVDEADLRKQAALVDAANGVAAKKVKN